MSRKKKIPDTKTLIRLIADAGLELRQQPGGGRHMSVYQGDRFVVAVSLASSPGWHTLLNYAREIKNRCGVDIREER